MEVLYVDCFAGLSGDMFLGALLDLGLKLGDLRRELRRLGLKGWSLAARKVRRGVIAGTQASVRLSRPGHDQHHRGLDEIVRLIRKARLPGDSGKAAEAVFRRLAAAEARVHGTAVARVHFHEVGALDALVDIAGTCLGLHLLGVKRLYGAPVPGGRGFVRAAHGTLPLPAPATLELLRGWPISGSPLAAELATPTGAALLTTLAEPAPVPPALVVEAVGYGAGQAERHDPPNLLRLVGGAPCGARGAQGGLWLLETNLDDCPGEYLGHLFEPLFAAGALDVWTTPVGMKKNRPGFCLSVLAPAARREALEGLLFAETTTLGVRAQPVERRALARRQESIATPFGSIPVKLASRGGQTLTVHPEYEACRRAAARHGVPLRRVYEAAQQRGWRAAARRRKPRTG